MLANEELAVDRVRKALRTSSFENGGPVGAEAEVLDAELRNEVAEGQRLVLGTGS